MNESNTFNFEVSLNQWMRTELDTYTPFADFSGFPGDRLILTMPEEPANVPAFSMHHLLIDTDDVYQGRRVGECEVGQRYSAFMDVSVWVSRLNAHWVSDKRWMCSILADLVNKTKSVQLVDYLGDYPTVPYSMPYAIYIDKIDARQTQPDNNKDFERERFLIKYHTILRSDVS